MKTLPCKTCGEPVEVKDQQRSVLCTDCAEKDWAEKEFTQEAQDGTPGFGERLHTALSDPRFRKGYLHQKALERAKFNSRRDT